MKPTSIIQLAFKKFALFFIASLFTTGLLTACSKKEEATTKEGPNSATVFNVLDLS